MSRFNSLVERALSTPAAARTDQHVRVLDESLGCTLPCLLRLPDVVRLEILRFATWTQVASFDWLVRAGEPDTNIYVLLTGRLQSKYVRSDVHEGGGDGGEGQPTTTNATEAAAATAATTATATATAVVVTEAAAEAAAEAGFNTVVVPGMSVGDLSQFEGARGPSVSEYTVRAIDDSVLLVISRPLLRSLLARHLHDTVKALLRAQGMNKHRGRRGRRGGAATLPVLPPVAVARFRCIECAEGTAIVEEGVPPLGICLVVQGELRRAMRGTCVRVYMHASVQSVTRWRRVSAGDSQRRVSAGDIHDATHMTDHEWCSNEGRP